MGGIDIENVIPSDLEADNLIEKYKELKEELTRLEKLEKDKIEMIKHNSEYAIEPIKNSLQYIENQLKFTLLNSKDIKETKTLRKKKFISGEVQVKKPIEKMVKPEIKDDELLKNDKLKDYREKTESYKLKWKELKEDLKIKDGKVINIVTGENYSDIVKIEKQSEDLIIK